MYKAIVSLVIFLSLLGCSDNSQRELLSSGIRSIHENNYLGAIAFLEKALQRDPNLFEARFQLAWACLCSDKRARAEKELRKVVYQSPSYANAQIALAGVYLNKEMPDEAFRHMESYLGRGYKEEEAFAIATLAHAMKGNCEDAVGPLNQATAPESGALERAIELASEHLLLGNVQETLIPLWKISQDNTFPEKTQEVQSKTQKSEYGFNEATESHDGILQFSSGDLNLLSNGDFKVLPAVKSKSVMSYFGKPYGFCCEGIDELKSSRELKSAVNNTSKAVFAHLGFALSKEREEPIPRR